MIFSSALLLLAAAASCGVYCVELTQPPSLVVKPQESFSISCRISVSSYCIHWIRQTTGKALEWLGYLCSGGDNDIKDSIKNKISFTQDTSKNTVFLQGKNFQTEDTAVYYCARVILGGDYFDYWGKGTKVTVSSAQPIAPKSIFAMAQCSSGSDGFLTVGCLARGFSPEDSLTFKWKDPTNKELSDFVQYPAFGRDGDYTKISHLRVKKSDWDPKKPYICEASNSKGRIDTKVAPPVKRVIPPTIALLSREEGDSIVLQCQLKDYYPDKLTVQWFRGGQPFSPADNKMWRTTDEVNKNFTYISQISISAQYEDKPYTCKATHNSEVFKQEYNMCRAKSVFKPSIQVKKANLRDILKKNTVTFSCIVEAPHSTVVSWQADGAKKDTGAPKHQANKIVSDWTLSKNKWLQFKTIVCTAKHPCFPEENVQIQFDDMKKDPVVVIRRTFEKSGQSGSALLECVVKDLPSGEVCINFQVNHSDISDVNCVDWTPSENIWSLTTHFKIPSEHQKEGNTFTCKVHRLLKSWASEPTGNIFDDPTIELVVSSANRSSSETQKLLCHGKGFNPKIKWISKSKDKIATGLDIVTMMEDGHVKVYSEILVPQHEWEQAVTYTCEINDGQSRKTVNTSICAVIAPSSQQAGVYLMPPSLNHVRPGTDLHLTCLVVGQSVKYFSFQWKKNGVNLNNLNISEQEFKDHGNGTQSKRSILQVPFQTWNTYAVFTCEVKHLCSEVRQQQNISKTRDPKKPTVRIFRPSDSDLSGLQNTSLLCFITGFFPPDISVQWQLNGMQLDESRIIDSPVVADTSGGFSMHSALILSASQWEEGVYSCMVFHESSKKPFHATLQNLYASLIHSAPSAKLLQDAKELVCLVYGFSPPAINITWLLGMTEVYAYNDTNPAKGPDGKFSIRSHLQLPSDWAPGEVYTCRVTHVTGTQLLNVSKKSAMFEEAIFMNENKAESITQDTVEEAWNMACAFLALFLLSLLYGCTVTLVKLKPK